MPLRRITCEQRPTQTRKVVRNAHRRGEKSEVFTFPDSRSESFSRISMTGVAQGVAKKGRGFVYLVNLAEATSVDGPDVGESSIVFGDQKPLRRDYGDGRIVHRSFSQGLGGRKLSRDEGGSKCGEEHNPPCGRTKPYLIVLHMVSFQSHRELRYSCETTFQTRHNRLTWRVGALLRPRCI